MKADAIIFDKDGTLIDFDAFWVAVSHKALDSVLDELSMTKEIVCEILEAFGVHNGVTSIDGVLCKGTYEQMGHIVYDILQRYGCESSCDEVTKLVIDAYNQNSDAGEVKPTCAHLADVLRELKAQGKKLAVVTTDNELITRKCLASLGILELFDKIYTDDGINPTKPDPYCAFDFCRFCGVDKDKMLMVGDTLTDVRFAKNAGISAIGLARSEENRAILAEHTDTVIRDMSELLNILD